MVRSERNQSRSIYEICEDVRNPRANPRLARNCVTSPSLMIYHYTNETGIKGILDTRRIEPSTCKTSGNAGGPWYGSAVYFTTVDPSRPTSDIMKHNYNIDNYKYSRNCKFYSKTEYVIAFSAQSIKAQQVQRAGRQNREVWICRRFVKLEDARKIYRRRIHSEFSKRPPYKCDVIEFELDMDGQVAYAISVSVPGYVITPYHGFVQKGMERTLAISPPQPARTAKTVRNHLSIPIGDNFSESPRDYNGLSFCCFIIGALLMIAALIALLYYMLRPV